MKLKIDNFMRLRRTRLKIAIMAVSLALIALGGGCVTLHKTGGQACPTKDCPPEDTVFMVPTPFGPMPVKMKKGFLNSEEKDENWITLGEYRKRMKEMENSIEEEETDEGEKIYPPEKRRI